MPIVVKAKPNDSTNDVIRKFKKVSAAADVVKKAKARRFFQKPSRDRSTKKIEMNRLRKRARSLKKTKNVSPTALQRIKDRLS